jgi:hypothetical protein
MCLIIFKLPCNRPNLTLIVNFLCTI